MNSNTTITEEKFFRLNQMLDVQLEQLERSQMQSSINATQNFNNFPKKELIEPVDEDKVKYEMEDLQTKISKLEHQFNKFSAQDEPDNKDKDHAKRTQFTENIQLTEDEEQDINNINQKFQKKKRGKSTAKRDLNQNQQHYLLQSSKKLTALEKSIEQAESQLNLSRYSVNQDSHSQHRSTRQQMVHSAKKVTVKQPRRNSFGFLEGGHQTSSRKRCLYDKQDSMLMKQKVEEQIEEENKIRQLEQQISKLKRERNQIQDQTRSEKLENKKIKEQIQKFNKLIVRVKQNAETNKKMQEEFDKLASFFEKSESIRKSQKTLIINLREELEGLKSKMQKTIVSKTVKKTPIGKKKKKTK